MTQVTGKISKNLTTKALNFYSMEMHEKKDFKVNLWDYCEFDT